MSKRDDKRAPKDLEAALEAELRQDRLEDPGVEFFADLQKQVMREVATRAAPGRPWWHPRAWGQWLWRPAPVAALASAATVALVVLWVGGPGGPLEITFLSPKTPAGGAKTPVARATPPDGKAWFAQLPPAEDLWAVEDEDLPALLAVLFAEEPDDDDEGFGDGVYHPAGEQDLGRLSQEQLRSLERLLDQQQSKKKKPARPRPAMRKAG